MVYVADAMAPKLLVPFIALPGLLVGCMLEPGNGEELASVDAAVAFNGFLPNASGSVQVRASASPSGPFVAWPGSSTTASATPYFFSVPDGSGGTMQIYRWTINVAVPEASWGSETGADGCNVKATYVRAYTGPYNLYSFDVQSDTYPGAASCLLSEFIDGEGILTALEACRSPDSPIVRLEAPGDTVHDGDVVITNQAQADALGCATTIDGNLTVAPPSPTTIDLPLIEHVTGDVSLSLPVEGPPMGPFQEIRCGSAVPSTVESVITRVHLPALTEVGGSVDVDAPSSGVGTTFGERIEVDLNALTTLGGDLSLSFETPAVSPCGLSSLATTGGDLSLSFAGGDVGGGSLLASLTSVDGEVAVSGGFTVIGLLGDLEHAGSLDVQSIGNPNPGSTLDALTIVDGTVYLHDLPGVPLLTGLTQAGAIVLDDIGASSLGLVGSSSVQAGGLSLLANASLSDLGTVASSNVDFTASASLEIGSGVDDNPSLSAAEVCDFVAYQQGVNGWTPAGVGFSCP